RRGGLVRPHRGRARGGVADPSGAGDVRRRGAPGAGRPPLLPGMTGASDVAGLTSDAVAERVAAGRAHAVAAGPVRTLGELDRATVLTWVNLIVGTLFVLVLVAGRPADGLFVGVILSNSVIGIVQELRARKALEQLAVLNTPHARVVRDGKP